MTKYFVSLFAMVLLVSSCNADNKGVQSGSVKDVKLVTKMDSVSYILGVNLGTQLSKDSLVPTIDAIAMGCQDALAGKIKLNDSSRSRIIQEFVAKLQEKEKVKQEAEMAKLKESAPQNMAAGQKFLDENKKKEGVQVTASGLQYKIVNPGSAKKPKPTDEVTVHYKGSLIDGKVFDSSYDRKQPASFPLGGVIPGWTEGLQLIGEGGKMFLYIPYNLAYGENGMGNVIPPSSTLVFEVELLKIGK
jgi:FKBP-type peptidyl-prolyl cis-trans isomerase FklB